jgi:hypothetical protein
MGAAFDRGETKVWILIERLIDTNSCDTVSVKPARFERSKRILGSSQMLGTVVMTGAYVKSSCITGPCN